MIKLSPIMRGCIGLLSGLFVLTACETVGGGGPDIYGEGKQPAPEQPKPDGEVVRNPNEYVQPPKVDDGTEPIRVALLLPLTSSSKNVETVAAAMSNAAQLAAFEAGDDRFLVILKDTKGTAEGASLAARESLTEGAEVILGPLFSESVEAVAAIARPVNVPMIAFSSDTKMAGDGVYLLSFPPEIEVARVTDYAIQQGYSRFGMLAPTDEYGSRVSNSFAEEVFVRGGTLVCEERYDRSPDAMLQPAKRLSKCAAETVNLQSGGLLPRDRSSYDPEGRLQLGEPGASPILSQNLSGGGFEAVLMPEQGTLLRALAPLLPYYDVNVKQVKLLGVSAWNNPRLTREPALNGGWFAAPDPALAKGFKQRYAKTFGGQPPRLASLAYDATLLTARLARNPINDRFTPFNIADPNGYLGADGLFRLTPDGKVERGLAILEIRSSGINVIDRAPESFVTGFETYAPQPATGF